MSEVGHTNKCQLYTQMCLHWWRKRFVFMQETVSINRGKLLLQDWDRVAQFSIRYVDGCIAETLLFRAGIAQMEMN